VTITRNRLMVTAAFAGLAMAWGAGWAGQDQAKVQASSLLTPPSLLPRVADSLVLDMANAGARIVAVGENGTISLSDDNGATFHRSRSVPVRTTLTSVYFTDERRGWAAGHLGVILATEDGGHTWILQRQNAERDQPLFDVFFSDAQNGLAVGLWSLLLRTTDGGRNWAGVQLPASKSSEAGDRNLFHIFVAPGGALYVTAEGGAVYQSHDRGATWRELETGYKGSLWAGTALPNGALLVGGLRGTVLRSDDGGASWKSLPVQHKASITALATDAQGHVLGSGLDGLVLRSADGQQISSRQLDGRPAMTGALVSASGTELLSSKVGVRTAPRW
jgi:photosystem II stability/assembly factor-like uncharacterized protein